MIDFEDVRRRYWRDQRGNRDAEIPVRGGDFIERDGGRNAVLFDVDRKMVAAYAVVGDRLRAAKAGEFVRAASTSKQSGKFRLLANCRDVTSTKSGAKVGIVGPASALKK
jgi:hypothetical protein